MVDIDTRQLDFMREVVKELSALRVVVDKLEHVLEMHEERSEKQVEHVLLQVNRVQTDQWQAINQCRADVTVLAKAQAGAEAISVYKQWFIRSFAGLLVLAVGALGGWGYNQAQTVRDIAKDVEHLRGSIHGSR